jgi:hypothetical protein
VKGDGGSLAGASVMALAETIGFVEADAEVRLFRQ